MSSTDINDVPADIRAERLVLPSPNGSTIAHHLAGQAPVVIGSCLRNATAVAGWITTRHPPGTASIAVISAGERWPDGTLRPSVEDLWGAGAILDALVDLGWTALSPEAQAARAGYRDVRVNVHRALRECASGRELTDRGYPDDVHIAAEVDASTTVPLLSDTGFTSAATQ